MNKATYYKDDNVHVYLTKDENLFFVHLDVDDFKPSVLKLLRQLFVSLKQTFNEYGVDLLFTSTYSPQIIKLMGLIHPIYECKTVEDTGVFVAAWNMED